MDPGKDVLYRMYVIEELPMSAISEELGIAVGSVFNYIKRHEIPVRPAHKGFKGKHHSEESKRLLSQRLTGKRRSEESRLKMSEAQKKGGIGHKKLRSDGYVKVYFPDHQQSTADGYIMEHILVMECIIGRHLRDDEVVHHINHKRDDNRKENLKLMTAKEHMSFHMKERWKEKKGEMTYQ